MGAFKVQGTSVGPLRKYDIIYYCMQFGIERLKEMNIGWIMVIYQLWDASVIDAKCIGKQTTQVVLQ